MKDLGVGCGVFVRLNFPLILRDSHLLNMGESFLDVNLIKENTEVSADPLPKLKLKLFGGPSTGEVFYFTGKENKITLGRMSRCDVHISDGLLSK